MKEVYDKTFIGIDYGERRIGIAKSDPTGLIASPIETLEVRSAKEALDKLNGIIDEFSPDGIVVGYPLHDSGDRTDKCRDIDAFVELLRERYDGPIFRVDERYSSQEATEIIHAHGKRVGQDKKRVDRLAAVIILQRFLDETPNVSRDEWLK